jgi:hypothetical protein
LHVSLSESSLKLPPSAPESFKISLILSGPIKFLWSIFWTRTQSMIFHIACDVRNIIWLVRPHWYFRPACLERGHNDSLRLIAGVNCDKTDMNRVKRQNSLLATVPSRESSIRTYMAGRKVNSHWNYTHGGV